MVGPRLFSIAIDQNSTVTFLGFGMVAYGCGISQALAFRVRDNYERKILQSFLDRVHLSVDWLDSFSWTPDKSGTFTVKSCGLEIVKLSNLSSSDYFKGLWRGLVPHRIEIFIWFALLGKLNTRNKLATLGFIPHSLNVCVLSTNIMKIAAIYFSIVSYLGKSGCGGCVFGTFMDLSLMI